MRPMLTLSVLGLASVANAWLPGGCKPFREIYADGEDLINRMWGDSFVYETDESKAYTMWWYNGGAAGEADNHDNPNELITTQGLNLTVPDMCHLDYFHKDEPSPEGESFTECHPWHDWACCHQATVMNPVAINKAYGAGYEWDRCGPISQACERFFVEEACFYECDVNMGLFRRFTDDQHTACTAEGVAVGATVLLADGTDYTCVEEWGANAENKWEIHQMPIKASYADAFFRACANDYFCDAGGFWDCHANYWEHEAWKAEVLANETAANKTKADEEADRLAKELEAEKDKGLPVWAIILIILFGMLGVICCFGTLCLVTKEKQGKPLFVEVDAKSSSTTKEANHA